MKTGDRVRKALEDAEVSQSEVGRRAGVTATSVGRWIKWLNDDELSDDQWMQFARALRSVGLKPEDFKPLPEPKPKLRVELVPLLEVFKDDKKCMEALVTILSSDEDAREPLLLLLRDRLSRMK